MCNVIRKKAVRKNCIRSSDYTADIVAGSHTFVLQGTSFSRDTVTSLVTITNVLHIRCCYLSFDIMTRGGVVVKALNYKPAGRGFDSRCCHWNFSVT